MKKLRAKVDNYLEHIGYWIYDHPWKSFLIVGLFLIITISAIPFIRIDVTTQGNFKKSDETAQRYLEFKKQFGTDASVVIAINPKEIFDKNFLATLRKLHIELEEEIPYLDEVTSLVNITAIKGESGELVIEDLMENWPETEDDLQKLKKYVFNNPSLVNNIISEEGDYTLIIVKADAFLEDDENTYLDESENSTEVNEASILSQIKNHFKNRSQNISDTTGIEEKTELTNLQANEIVARVSEIVKKYQSDEFPLFVTGGPVIDKLHVDIIGATVRKTIGISILCIFLLLFFIFRRLSGILIPILIVLLSLASTFGLMALLGIPLRVTSQAFPPIVLAAGICDAVHLFTMFYQKLKTNLDKRTAIAYAMKHSGLAMFFTTLTTAGGFLSFAFADLKGIGEMGMSAAMGILLALFYTFLLVPSLIAVLPIKTKTMPQKSSGKASWEQILEKMAGFSVSKPYYILIPTLLIIVMSSIGAANIKFSFNMIKWFPKDTMIDANNTIIEKKFKSTSSLEVVIDTGKENGIFEPTVMNAIEAAQNYAEGIQSGAVKVGKTISIVDSLKLINRSLNGDNPKSYSIPQDKNTIAQEMILFENSGWENLEELVDSKFSKTRLTIGVPTVNAIEYVPFGNKVKVDLESIFSGIAKVSVTGVVDIGARNILGLMESLSKSYLMAFIIIGLLMIVFLGSLRIGLISMVPNFLPILIVLGIMGAHDIPITMFSVLLGGIALGLAVDDTIHFLHNFKRCFDENNNIYTSVIETVRTTGRALFFTTIIISIGFASYLSADMNILVTFGLMISLTVALAFIADIVVTPALVKIVYGSKEKTGAVTFSREL